MTLSELLCHNATATIGTPNNEAHVVLAVTSHRVLWCREACYAVASELGLVNIEEPSSYGYIRRTEAGWVCQIWHRGRSVFSVNNISNHTLYRDAKHIPPALLLVSSDVVDDVAHALLSSGHRQVSGVLVPS